MPGTMRRTGHPLTGRWRALRSAGPAGAARGGGNICWQRGVHYKYGTAPIPVSPTPKAPQGSAGEAGEKKLRSRNPTPQLVRPSSSATLMLQLALVAPLSGVEFQPSPLQTSRVHKRAEVRASCRPNPSRFCHVPFLCRSRPPCAHRGTSTGTISSTTSGSRGPRKSTPARCACLRPADTKFAALHFLMRSVYRWLTACW